MNKEVIRKNYQEICESVAYASKKSGKKVKLIAAIKYADEEHINYYADELGILDFGENRVQQLLEHIEKVKNTNVQWHFIGSLQKNKVKYIIDKVCMIHSVDSVELAKEIEKQAAKHKKTMDVLIEINSGNEESKTGISFDGVENLAKEIISMPHLNLCGFMTMAPKTENPEDSRKYFRETVRVCLDIWQKKLHNSNNPVFSMGMSDTYIQAIEEGSDMVRIGRGLFKNDN